MRRTLLAFALILAAACGSTRVGPYEPLSEVSRETSVAEQLNREAADLLRTEPKKAEALLREALTKDLFFGPAHNNLGVLFLEQKKLYEAANEFEWARKLMPESPDPRINLALVLERAGRINEALRSYEAALEVAPECLPAMQGAACLVARRGDEDPRLSTWLENIALRTDDAHWRRWARERLVWH